MTAGCISRIFDIPKYIYNSKDKQLGKSKFFLLKQEIEKCCRIYKYVNPL